METTLDNNVDAKGESQQQNQEVESTHLDQVHYESKAQNKFMYTCRDGTRSTTKKSYLHKLKQTSCKIISQLQQIKMLYTKHT